MYEQDRVLTRLQLHVQRDRSIILCLLEGSHGRRTADAYADLDVVLGYSGPANRDQAWEERERFAGEIMPYVAARSMDGPYPFVHQAVYANGARVDFRYAIADDLQPAPQRRALKAPVGWEEQQKGAPVAPPGPDSLTVAQLDAIDRRFWILFMDVERRLQRGDCEKPFPDYLALLHEVVQPLFRGLPAGAARKPLVDVHFTTDAAHNLAQLRRLLSTYRQARAAVIATQRLAFTPDRAFERGIERILGLG